MDTVLVTGATGHLGYNLVRILVEKGYSVRAGVRDAGDSRRIAPLKALGATVVETDILRRQTLMDAMSGVDGIFHLAAVYSHTSMNPEKEIREPSMVGGRNVLMAAVESGVNRVVLTSSTTAVGADTVNGQPLTERDWNSSTAEPYARTKTDAELQAWDIAAKHHMDLVTIVPAAIIGPGFFRHTPSTQLFEQLLRGKIPFSLPLYFSFVDVRDVAEAHELAYSQPQASGRYIVSSYFGSLTEVFRIASEVSPGIRAPRFQLPSTMLGIVPALDRISNMLLKTPRFATNAFIREYARRKPFFSSKRIEQGLGWEPMDFRISVKDTVEWIKGRTIAPAA